MDDCKAIVGYLCFFFALKAKFKDTAKVPIIYNFLRFLELNLKLKVCPLDIEMELSDILKENLPFSYYPRLYISY